MKKEYGFSLSLILVIISLISFVVIVISLKFGNVTLTKELLYSTTSLNSPVSVTPNSGTLPDFATSSYFGNNVQLVQEADNVTPDNGFIILSTIYSHRQDKLLIAQVEKSILNATHSNYNAVYKIDIKDLVSGKVSNILNQSVTAEDYLSEIPVAWSINDKFIVTKWGNLTTLGRGGGPEYIYSAIDITSNKLYGLTQGDSVLSPKADYIFYLDSSDDGYKDCTSGWGYPGDIIGSIMKVNIESRVKTKLVGESLVSYGPLALDGDYLNYTVHYYKFQETKGYMDEVCYEIDSDKSVSNARIKVY